MPSVFPKDHLTDRADLIALQTASGSSVEVMRTWYWTQVFPRHTHDYFTIGVMLQGVGTLWYRGVSNILHSGDVIVIPPGEVHTGGLVRNGEALGYLALHVPQEVLTTSAEAEGLRGGKSPEFGAAIIRDAVVGGELRRLAEELNLTRADANRTGMASSEVVPRIHSEAANDALNSALGLLVRRHAASLPAPASNTSQTEPNMVRVTREIIEDCFADNEQTALRALALRVGVTPCHLVRVFTQTIGLSPHGYVVQTRVRRASQLLTRGIPSSSVAAMTGFVDQSHLTLQFKRYIGTTPAFYQKCLAAPKGTPVRAFRPPERGAPSSGATVK